MVPFLSERQTPHSSPFVCPAPPPPPNPRCLPRCPTRIPARSWHWAEPYIHIPVQMVTPRQGRGGGSRACRNRPATCRAPRHASHPRAGLALQCGPPRRFGSCAFAFQGPGRGHGGQSGPRPEAAAASASRPPVGEQRHLHENRNSVCRKDPLGGCIARFSAPQLCAPPGTRKAAGWGDRATERPPHTARSRAGGNSRLGARFCRLSALFTETQDRARTPAPRTGQRTAGSGGCGSQVPALPSAAQDLDLRTCPMGAHG